VPCCAACNKGKKCLTPAERILMELESANPAAPADGLEDDGDANR
jgi:hypothetical protein